MTPRTSAPKRAQVHVNGPALRLVRELLGREADELAAKLHVTRNYIYRLELGHSRTCSPSLYTRMVEELKLPDPRALLACPWGDNLHDGPEAQRWNVDSDAATAPFPKPRTEGAGRHRRSRREPVKA